MMACKCMWETSEKAKRRGQANARCVAKVQYRNILELGHSQRERCSRVHKGNLKEVKVREEFGSIARNNLLEYQIRGGHRHVYPNSG